MSKHAILNTLKLYHKIIENRKIQFINAQEKNVLLRDLVSFKRLVPPY